MSDRTTYRLGIMVRGRISDASEQRLIELDVLADARYHAIDILRSALQRLCDEESARVLDSTSAKNTGDSNG